METPVHTYTAPDWRGRFGDYGGAFVPEILWPVLEELKTAYAEAQIDPAFLAEYHQLLREYVGRPTP
ncbi:MAG: tryptophan synthase subunit beta, partial [Rhodothermaceae bacterium]|nr:tryptophan synthase subunit beta [Rhodothermaceae bacterium]